MIAKVTSVEPDALIPVIVYIFSGAGFVGLPEMRPVVTSKLKPLSIAGDMEYPAMSPPVELIV